MNSSGIKRGLATTAVSALAIAGLPLFASSASATPVSADYTADGTLTSADVELLNPDTATGETTTQAYNLVAAGSTDAERVQFQFQATGATTWTNIGSPVSRVNGAFTQSFTPSGPGTVRVVGIDAAGDLFDGSAGAPGTAVDTAAINVNLPALSATAKVGGPVNVGVWNTKATAAGASAFTMAVTGTTSLTDGATPADDDYRVNLDQRTGGTGTAVADVAADGTFAGVLPLTGYTFTPGGPDQVVVGAEPRDNANDGLANSTGPDGALANIEDAAAKTLYLQQLESVTATAKDASLQPGEKTDVTVSVLDSTGAPIAGANVWRAAPGTTTAQVGVTDAAGKIVDANVAGLLSGNYTYFVNAPANTIDNPQDSVESVLGDKSGSVAISLYTPGLTKVTVDSLYGPAADIDEVDSGTPFLLTALDQENAPLQGEQLYYTWTVDPFAANAPTVTSNEQMATSLTDAKGQVAIDFATVSDFTPALGSLPSGKWTLQVFRKPVGGTGAFQAAPVNFTFGQAEVVYNPADVQAPQGGSTAVGLSLELEDGTALGSIDRADNDPVYPGQDIDRSATFTYATGDEDPTTPGTQGGDSRIAPILEQDSKVVDSATATTASVTFDKDGAASLKVNDANPETNEEIDAVLSGKPAGNLGTSPTTTVEVDFLETVVANTVTGSVGAIKDVDGGYTGVQDGTPGRPVVVTFNVKNENGATLSNKEVAITVTGGGFITDNTVAPYTDAQKNGTWANKGTTATVKTDALGNASVTVAIEKNEGFDDDFLHTVQVSASVDSKSASQNVTFEAADAVDVGDLTIEPTDEDNNLPDAQVGFETIEFDVYATDQFGNLSKEAVTVDDANNGRAFVNGAQGAQPVTSQNELDTPAVAASANSANTQTITASVVDPAGNAASSTISEAADAINWYVVDFAASSFTLQQLGDETVPTGTRVTEVLTVLDQKGNAVQGLTVDFLRSGPGDEDSDGNGTDFTDAEGKAYYDFTGGAAGTARVSAVVKNGLTRVGSADDTVTFEGQIDPVEDVVTKLKARNNGATRDKLKVSTGPAAVGADATLFKFKKNGKRVQVASRALNDLGKATFKVADKNGRKRTSYQVVVSATETTNESTSNKRKVR